MSSFRFRPIWSILVTFFSLGRSMVSLFLRSNKRPLHWNLRISIRRNLEQIVLWISSSTLCKCKSFLKSCLKSWYVFICEEVSGPSNIHPNNQMYFYFHVFIKHCPALRYHLRFRWNEKSYSIYNIDRDRALVFGVFISRMFAYWKMFFLLQLFWDEIL